MLLWPSRHPQNALNPRVRRLTTTAVGSEPEAHPVENLDIKSQRISNRSYWTKKIYALACTPGRIDAALRLVDSLRLRGFHPDPTIISSIIHGLCAAGRSGEAHRRLLFSFQSGNLIPDDRTSNILLARLLDSSAPRLTLSVIRHLLLAKPDFVPSLTNYNRLIHQLSFLSSPLEAYRLVLDMISRGRCPDVVTYTTLIHGFGGAGLLEDARKVFDEMIERNIQPNSLTYSVFIKWLLRRRMVDEGKVLMERLWLRMQYEEDRAVNSAAFANLIDSLCMEGFFHEVFRIAEEMPQGKFVCEEFAYGQMMDSLCKSRRHHGASRILYIMRKRGFFPSLVSYNSIVHGLSKERGCTRAYQLLKEGIEFGYLPPEPTYKVLIEALCREKDLCKAKDVTELMLSAEKIDKTRIYNIFLSGLQLADNSSEQLNVLTSMLQKQCHPDSITLNTVIHGFCRYGKVDEAIKILDDMMDGKFCSPDVITFTTIVCGLIDVGRFEEAFHLMHKVMPQRHCSPNTVTYNAVLRRLFKHGMADKSMEIFDEMERKGLHADCITQTIIIEGLCQANRLEHAKKFWDERVWPSRMHDDYVYAAIMRGLCRLGKLDVACDFLYELVDCGVSPGIVNYNVLIDSACKQGLKNQAYQIVGEMRKNGLKPDSVTWRILNRFHVTSDGIPEEIEAGEEIPAMPRELIVDVKGCLHENLGGDGHRLGLADISIPAEFVQDDVIDEVWSPPMRSSSHRPIHETKVVEQMQKKTLSKLASRVFGLVPGFIGGTRPLAMLQNLLLFFITLATVMVMPQLHRC